MELGARNKAKELGVNLMWQGSASDYSPQTQMPFVDAALTNGVDALILVPTDPNAMQPAVTRAESMKIPVITVDTTVTDQCYLTSFITGDNVDGGHQAAETLANLIGRKGKVFIMSGSPSATTDVARENGFREAIKQLPDIEIVGIQYANSQPANATSAVNTILLKYPDLAGIFALDGTSGTGTVAALRNANKAGQVKLVGYDAYKAEVDALKEGIFTALVAQQPAKEADLALQYAYDKITGKDVGSIQKTVVIPERRDHQGKSRRTPKSTCTCNRESDLFPLVPALQRWSACPCTRARNFTAGNIDSIRWPFGRMSYCSESSSRWSRCFQPSTRGSSRWRPRRTYCRTFSPVMLMAIGQTFVIASGGIDLSVGSAARSCRSGDGARHPHFERVPVSTRP